MKRSQSFGLEIILPALVQSWSDEGSILTHLSCTKSSLESFHGWSKRMWGWAQGVREPGNLQYWKDIEFALWPPAKMRIFPWALKEYCPRMFSAMPLWKREIPFPKSYHFSFQSWCRWDWNTLIWSFDACEGEKKMQRTHSLTAEPTSCKQDPSWNNWHLYKVASVCNEINERKLPVTVWTPHFSLFWMVV